MSLARMKISEEMLDVSFRMLVNSSDPTCVVVGC